MLVQEQALGAILVIVQIVLAPLIIGLVVGLAGQSARRTIIAAAITAAAIIFVSAALIEALTGFSGPVVFFQAGYSRPGELALSLAQILLSVGLDLSFAAVILGLRETARLRRWGWFWAFLLTQVVAGIVTQLYFRTFGSYLFTIPLFRLLIEGNLPINISYYLVTSLLLVAVPLAVLLFANVGIPAAEPASLVTPVGQPAAPYPPYPQYPQHPPHQ
jgi:hypothetical protein